MGTGDVVLALAGQTNSATTLDLSLPTSGGRPSYNGATVERRDGPSWLRDDDDDDSNNNDNNDNVCIGYSRVLVTP